MRKHVFLSFVEEDRDLVALFRGHAKNKKSDLAFDDYSVKVPYNSANAAYIRQKISGEDPRVLGHNLSDRDNDLQEHLGGLGDSEEQ